MTEQDFTLFWQTNERRFAHFARTMSRRDEMIAEDASAHAFISVWLKWKDKTITEAIDMYMVRYAYRAIATYAIKRWRRKDAEQPYDPTSHDYADTSQDGNALLDQLDECLAHLPRKQEALIRVCFLADPKFTPEEAAQLLGYHSLATMYRHREKALQMLREGFGDISIRTAS